MLDFFHRIPFGAAGRFLPLLPLVVGGLAGCARAPGPLDPKDYDHPIRLACVGDSITEGAGASPGNSYPDQLQKILGDKWAVKNFGVGGRTMLRQGDLPWWNEPAFRESQAFAPDAVVIMLGTNDTKPQNWPHHGEFQGDYRDLIDIFKALPTKPHIWICRPPPVPEPGNYGINETNLQVCLARIDELASAENVREIDIHAALLAHPELLPDHVHPNDQGARIIAQTVAQAVSGK